MDIDGGAHHLTMIGKPLWMLPSIVAFL